MNRTKIEWALNPDGTPGYTWNPITGCLNGCPYCYARKLADGRLKARYLANKNHAPIIGNTLLPNLGFVEMNPFYPRFWQERVRENFGAWTSGAIPKGIFVCDMSDLFGKGIPREWTQRVLNHIGMSWYQEHRFYLLTKQPQNLAKFSPFPDNCYVGVTITTLDLLDRALKYLPEIEAKVKFASFEPYTKELPIQDTFKRMGLDWAIIGGQTRPTRLPTISSVREIIIEACDAGVPFFLKNNLKPLFSHSKLTQQYPKSR